MERLTASKYRVRTILSPSSGSPLVLASMNDTRFGSVSDMRAPGHARGCSGMNCSMVRKALVESWTKLDEASACRGVCSATEEGWRTVDLGWYVVERAC